MKVYVIEDYHDGEVWGVFSTKQKAEDYIQMIFNNYDEDTREEKIAYMQSDIEITEHELDFSKY